MSNIERIIELEKFIDGDAEQLESARWEAARLIAEELESGKSKAQVAREISKSEGHVRHMAKVWESYLGTDERPLFNKAYQEAKKPKHTARNDVPITPFEQLPEEPEKEERSVAHAPKRRQITAVSSDDDEPYVDTRQLREDQSLNDKRVNDYTKLLNDVSDHASLYLVELDKAALGSSNGVMSISTEELQKALDKLDSVRETLFNKISEYKERQASEVHCTNSGRADRRTREPEVEGTGQVVFARFGGR